MQGSIVLNGTLHLDTAYKHAHLVKISTEGEEGVMRKLRAEAPDLADQVVEERLSLSEAAAALQARKQKESTDRYGTWQVLNSRHFLFSNPQMAGDAQHGTVLVLDDHWEFYSRTEFERDFGGLPFQFAYSDASDKAVGRYTVAEAMRAVEAHKPDGVLLDIMFGESRADRLGLRFSVS